MADSMTRATAPDWDPDQYRRFAAERAQPFHDLLDRLGTGPFDRAVDLGCGPGELTALAAERLSIGRITGIDNSPTMLASAAEHASERVTFEVSDIATWTSEGDHDLVLAAASLQWVPDHRSVLARWVAALAPGGRLAVQVPANAHAPTHTVAAHVADREANAAFLVDYEQALIDEMGDHEPCFFPFNRILFVARRPSR